jgi:hypothetical protein
MSIRVTLDAIYLEGRCMVEDAETLLVALQQNPELPVDIGGLQRLHMAVAQVMLSIRPPMRGEASDIFLSRHVLGRRFDGDKAPEPA